MGEETADQEALVLDSVDRFCRADIDPYARQLEAADRYPAEIVEKMKVMGLFGATIPQDYGGLGLSTLT